MKLLYKPFGLLLGVIGGLLAGAAFRQVWKRVGHDEDTPNATDRQRGWSEVVLAAMVEGAIFGGVKAAVDRAGASGYQRVTGVWPGDEQPQGD